MLGGVSFVSTIRMSKTDQLLDLMMFFEDGRWRIPRRLAQVLLVLLAVFIGWGMVISHTPDVLETPRQPQAALGVHMVDAGIGVASTLLDKRGGYISNDVTPPAWWLDNIQNWEFGVLKMTRDFARVLRNELSRSQSQSTEDAALAQAEPKFSIDHDSWMFPRAEGKYREGISLLQDYRARLAAADNTAHFHANAENLVDYLQVVEKRLGNMVQRLGMSVGKVTVDDASFDALAETGQSRPAPGQVGETVERTSWFSIDDVFFEARGTVWALLAILQAAETDFAAVLTDKQASIQYRQILRELEAANAPLRTPMILNGGGFSMWPNHSLVMASYLGSANAALANLIGLLENG